MAEEMAADDSDPEMVGLYIERLYDLNENPVDINSNDPDELSRLFFLTEFQINVITDYTTRTGGMVSLYEIANLPGFDRETAMMLQSFIILKENTGTSPVNPYLRTNLLTNISYRTSDIDSLWKGSPYKILARYRFSSGGFSGGMTAEKDAGEKLIDKYNHLPDMFSGNFAWKGKGILKRFVIGDYAARFGQGTNINTAVRNYYSLLSPGYLSAKNEIRPYTSTDENSFFRGAGAEFSLGKLSLILIWSDNLIDATKAISPDGEYIETLYKSGIHNTDNTLKKKDVVSDKVYGANLDFNHRNIRVGFSWSEEKFSLPFKPAADNPEKIFSFSGDHNSIYSTYYNFLKGKFNLFGEVSVNEHINYGAVQGISLRPSDRLTINMLLRAYDKGFQSFHGKGPGSYSYPHQSVVSGFSFEAAKHFFITGGCEITKYPWLRYNISSPSWSLRKELRLKYTLSDSYAIEGTYYYYMTAKDAQEMSSVPDLSEYISRSYNASFRFSSANNLTLVTKLYYKTNSGSGNRGTVILQDINYRLPAIPLSFWLRFSVFRSESWDTRIYVYENDLLYSFSVPAIYGTGSRHYLMLSWKIKNKAELRLRYSVQSGIFDSHIEKISEEFRVQVRLAI